MTPRPGDLPETSGPAEQAPSGQTAYSPTYSAPSPADRPTAMPRQQPAAPTGPPQSGHAQSDRTPPDSGRSISLPPATRPGVRT
jgi:hypothetical protein